MNKQKISSLECQEIKLSELQWGNYICHVQDKGILHHTCLLIYMD